MVFSRKPLHLLIAVLGLACSSAPEQPSRRKLVLLGRHLLSAVPESMQFPIRTALGGRVTYLGLDLEGEKAVRGEELYLTHYWHVHEPVPGWNVFVHLNGNEHNDFLIGDHVPVSGVYPAGEWKKGDIVRDGHSVLIPKHWRSKTIAVSVGLFNDGGRMKPAGPYPDSRIPVATIPVVGESREPASALHRQLTAERTAVPLALDGELTEPVWGRAPKSVPLAYIMTGALAPVRSTVQAAWDEENLYLAIDNEDADIWLPPAPQDSDLWSAEAVEIVFPPDTPHGPCRVIQVSPANVVSAKVLRHASSSPVAWQSGVKSATRIAGTLDDRSDADHGWTLEMALPWASLGLPKDRRSVSVNFFRVERHKSDPVIELAWSVDFTGQRCRYNDRSLLRLQTPGDSDAVNRQEEEEEEEEKR
jgi:hypothetical protein